MKGLIFTLVYLMGKAGPVRRLPTPKSFDDDGFHPVLCVLLIIFGTLTLLGWYNG